MEKEDLWCNIDSFSHRDYSIKSIFKKGLSTLSLFSWGASAYEESTPQLSFAC
jgi:hypothetical protein